MAEEKIDAKEKEEVTPPEESSTPEGKPEETKPPAEGAKTETESKGEQKEEELPWHKDPRWKKFQEDRKTLEDAKESLDALQTDSDFATFLAFKRQKEAMAKEEKKVDFSTMSAGEYAEYVAEQAEKRADERYQTLVEANKKGDEISKEAVVFAESIGVAKNTFDKEYAPKIIEYYENVAKKIGENNMDSFVEANPPKEVFKSLHFDKASEAGVMKYKKEVDKAKGAGFEEEGGTGVPPTGDAKSQFDKNWQKLFGNASELPDSAFEKNR